MTRKTWLIVALLAILSVLFLAACQGKPKGTPTPTPTPTPAFARLVYRNAEEGVTLSYPAQWTKTDTGQKAPLVEIKGPDGIPVVQVSVRPLPQAMTVSDYAGEVINALKEGISNVTEVSRGEVSLGPDTGYQAVFTGIAGITELKAKVMVMLRGSRAYDIIAFSNRPNYERYESAIEFIFSTFRLEEASLGGVSRNQSFTVGSVGPVTLDPALAREGFSIGFIVELYSGLVSLDKDIKVVPELARSWDISPDGKVYTFRLRQGAKFHGGREVTAEDFKYSIERAADPNTGSQTASLYLGDIVGVKDKLAGNATEVSGVQVVDRSTLRITIDSPKAYFLKKLTHAVAMVVDKDNVTKGDEWWRQPNGTGSYKLKEWKEDDIVILERNADYYLGAPKLPYAVYRLFAGIPMLMYESGEIDMTGVSLDDLERAQDVTNPLNKELVTSAGFSLEYIGFNHTQPPFDDPTARLALTYATDREKLAELVFKNTVRPARGILPPGFPGYNPDVKGVPFDPVKAKELLAQSKYGGDGPFPSLVFTTSSFGTEPGLLVSALVNMWQANLGITFENVRIMSPDEYTYNLKAEKDNVFDLGWAADYPDPENFLDILFHSGSTENLGEYSNPEVDALLEKARAERDEGQRMALYGQIEQKIVDDAAVIPLFFDIQYVLVKPHVKGFVPMSVPAPMLKYISLER